MALVTSIQMYFAYHNARVTVNKELQQVEKSFSKNLQTAVFNLDDPTIEETIKGIYETSSVVGVELQDEFDARMGSRGDVNYANKKGPTHHQFKLYGKHQNEHIATVNLYSSQTTVLEMIKGELIFIIINNLTTTSILLLITYLLLGKFLSSPMKEFSRNLEDLSIEILHTVSIDYPYDNELKKLHDNIDVLISNGKMSKQSL